MYFLPFSGRTRFVAFEDTPETELALKTFLSGTRTWEDLESNLDLQNKIVDGNAILGVFFKKGKTFITNSVGLPQIEFNGNPRTLLFAFGPYSVSQSSGSLFFDRISLDYARYEISAHSYDPTLENLQEIYDTLETLDDTKLNRAEITSITNQLNAARADIQTLASRNDPLTVIIPALAAEAGEREEVIRDILLQLAGLNAPIAEGVINVGNYVRKDEFFDLLSKRPLKSYVDGVLATKASNTELANHVFDNTLHNPTYVTIGSPSNAQFNTLSDLVTSLQTRITALEALDPITSLTTVGGITASQQSSGVWVIDSSGVGIGTGDKPQETVFYFGGMLQTATDTGGKWKAWEDCQIIGITASLKSAPQDAPVVVDIKKNGVTIFGALETRPTILHDQTEIEAPLPDNVELLENDVLTVDILSVGTTFPGEDLTVQIRFEYVN